MAITAGQPANTEVVRLGSGWVEYPNGVLVPDNGMKSVDFLDEQEVYKLGEVHNGTMWVVGLVKSTGIPIPKKLIWSEEKRDMLESLRVRSLNMPERGELGLFFWGEKGSGKSVMAAVVAKMFKAPLINLTEDIRLEEVDKILNSTKNKAMVLLMDESSKWNLKGDRAIKFFDQDAPYYKIIIMTSNTNEGMDDRLMNRSRVMYNMFFEKIDNEIAIQGIVEEYKPKKLDLITNFIKNTFESATIDTITMLLEELKNLNMLDDITLEENDILRVMQYMNIKTAKNAKKYSPKMSKLTPHTTVEEIYNRLLVARPNLAREQFENLFIQALEGMSDPRSKENGKKQYKKLYFNNKYEEIERGFAKRSNDRGQEEFDLHRILDES